MTFPARNRGARRRRSQWTARGDRGSVRRATQPGGSRMIGRTALTTLAMVAGLTLPAQAQVKLAYKYPEGSSARYKTTSKTHQILTIAGMDVETEANETI